jgi:amidase/aspartyl-tRNA(Asn)/glutamyl-tRNA(Gln) amidotransferase subunit A
MSLARLVAAVARGQVTATELVERSLQRIDRAAALGAVVTTCPDRAQQRAAEMDRGGPEGMGPLAGLPVLVKDSHDVTGLPTSHGSWLYVDSPPARRTSPSPARLEAAGAIVVGKTNVPELCAEGFTDNVRFGPTANPWGPSWSPGGSSGGSSAALAAGLCAVATSSDGGGSTRIPASWCGLLGLKPTMGLIGRRPIPAWMDMSTDGVLAQGADDLRLLLGVLRGPVDGDVTTAVPRATAAPLPDRLVAMPRFVDRGALPESVAGAFWPAVEALGDALAARIETRDSLLVTGDADRDWFVLTTTEQAWALGEQLLEAKGEQMDALVYGYLRRGLATPTGDYLAARRRRYGYAAELDAALPVGSVLVTPTIATEGISPNGWLPGRRTRGSHVSLFNTMVHNLTGHPAISLPAGRLTNGLPFGLQVTARRWDDDLLVDIAAAWERAHPWPPVAPGYEPFDSSSG